MYKTKIDLFDQQKYNRPSRIAVRPKTSLNPQLVRQYLSSCDSKPLRFKGQYESSIKINKPYVLREKRFNQYHKNQIKINQQKFQRYYCKVLSMLIQKSETNLVNDKKLLKINSHYSDYSDFQYENQNKSEAKTLAQTSHKIFVFSQDSKNIVQPLVFKDNMRTPIKNNRKKPIFGQTTDKPSSCRTIILDLQELIERQDK